MNIPLQPEPESSTLPDGETIAAYRQVAGGALVFGALPTAGAGLALGVVQGSLLLFTVGVFATMVLVALAATRASSKCRPIEPLGESIGDETGEAPPQGRRRRGRRWRGLAFGVAVLGLIALFAPRMAGAVESSLPSWAAFVGKFLRGVPTEGLGSLSAGLATWLAVAGAALAVGAALLGPYFARCHAGALPEGRGLASWFRFAVWVLLAASVGLVVSARFGMDLAKPIANGLVFVVAFLAFELGLRAMFARRAAPAVDDGGIREARIATDLLSLRLTASSFSPIGSLFGVLAEVFGIDLKGAWALAFIRRSLVPLGLGLALVAWLGTSLVVVNVDEQGALERFGRLRSTTPLEPGMHLVFPWPIDRVRRVAVHRVDSMTIGYAGQIEGASRLWTVRHSEEEYNLLVGDGTDLVTVNGLLYYRPSDALRFLYSYQNPVEMLQTISDRVLMRNTQDREIENVLSENLVRLGETMQAQIQEEVDRLELGIEVVDLALVGLHPPVAVAIDYQQVVGAAIEKQASILEAEVRRSTEIPNAVAEAASIRGRAESARLEQMARAEGEAEAFRAQLRAYQIDPRLFRVRRYLERREELLKDRKFHVIDDRIYRDGAEIWHIE